MAQTIPVWRKSSKCATSECLQVAGAPESPCPCGSPAHNDVILIGDTKQPGDAVRYTPAAFADFIRRAKAGELDGLVS